jgi:hypothetical protein
MTELCIFLSYRSEDLPARMEFEAADLAGRVCRYVEIAATGSPDDWQRRYQEMIADVEGVIVLVGPRTAGSEPIRWEIEEAIRRDKRVVGVQIHNGQHPIPDALSAWPVLDWDAAQIEKELGTWLPKVPTNTTVRTI